MIYKDGETTIIEFGAGDIGITAGFMDDTDVSAGVVSFNQGVPGEIGSRYKAKSDYGCDGCNDLPWRIPEHTRLVFNDTRSIDVVIDLLLKAKQYMLE